MFRPRIYNCMSICGAKLGAACGSNTTANCPNKHGCEAACPDFTIKRHDTIPAFKISVEDCDGPLDLSDESIIVEVNMWAKAKLKAALAETDTYFALADGIGFEQALAGDIIIVDRARLPEQMLVLGFDETNKLIQVQRGYHGTAVGSYAKGTKLRIFRIMNANGTVEYNREDFTHVDGSREDRLTKTFIAYDWAPNDTCLSGCYRLEFKVIKVTSPTPTGHHHHDDDWNEEDDPGGYYPEDSSDSSMEQYFALVPSVIPSFTPSTIDFGCITAGAEWVRRFPVDREGFIVHIVDSPTSD